MCSVPPGMALHSHINSIRRLSTSLTNFSDTYTHTHTHMHLTNTLPLIQVKAEAEMLEQGWGERIWPMAASLQQQMAVAQAGGARAGAGTGGE